jgi:phosphoribosylformylglycinamidine synthase
LAAFQTGFVVRCSDLGAAGIEAAVSESARFGGLGAWVDLALVPLTEKGANNTPTETLANETQARYLIHVEEQNVEAVLEEIRSQGVPATVIGEITDSNEVVFMYGNETVATLPNNLTDEMLAELRAA